MNLGAPGWLAGLLAVIALAVVTVLSGRDHAVRLGRVFHPAWLERVRPRSVRLRRRWRSIAALLGLAAGFVALAEPRTDKQLQALEARGTDLVVAVDLSRSMDARDVEPSRIDRARREVADLLARLEADRVGLVVFAGRAYARLPLTADLRAVNVVLGEMSPDRFAAQGSDVGGAIRASLQLLARDPTPAGKAVIVFSDGEVHDPDAALAAAREAAAAKIPVYTVGIGIEAAPIPVQDGFLTWQGQTVTTAPDPELLKAVARETGGAYVSSVAAATDMTSLVQELRRALASVARAQHQRETWRSLYQLPLGISAALLLLASWLGDGRRVAMLAAILLFAPLAHAGTLAEADEAYRSGNWREASRQFEELSLESPTDPDLLERLAASRYRLQDFEGAARAWDQASRLRGSNPDDKFNAANAHYQAGRLERARDLYDEVLAERPDDDEARANRDLVAQEIEARRAIPPPPPPTGGGGENDEQDPNEGGQEAPAPAPADPASEAEAQDGDGEPSSSGQAEQPMAGEPGSDDVGGEDQTQRGGQGGIDGEGGAPISAAQAERLLEGIEEGQPAYQYGGPPGGPPW